MADGRFVGLNADKLRFETTVENLSVSAPRVVSLGDKEMPYLSRGEPLGGPHPRPLRVHGRCASSRRSVDHGDVPCHDDMGRLSIAVLWPSARRRIGRPFSFGAAMDEKPKRIIAETRNLIERSQPLIDATGEEKARAEKSTAKARRLFSEASERLRRKPSRSQRTG